MESAERVELFFRRRRGREVKAVGVDEPVLVARMSFKVKIVLEIVVDDQRQIEPKPLAGQRAPRRPSGGVGDFRPAAVMRHGRTGCEHGLEARFVGIKPAQFSVLETPHLFAPQRRMHGPIGTDDVALQPPALHVRALQFQPQRRGQQAAFRVFRLAAGALVEKHLRRGPAERFRAGFRQRVDSAALRQQPPLGQFIQPRRVFSGAFQQFAVPARVILTETSQQRFVHFILSPSSAFTFYEERPNPSAPYRRIPAPCRPPARPLPSRRGRTAPAAPP